MASIIPAIISAAATLVVCLINNGYQRRRDERARKAKQEQDELARENEREAQQADLTAHLEEIIANQNESTNQIHNEIEMLRYQMSELAKHVDKHNNVIERTYELEKRTELQEEKIKVANHRLEDLEKAVGQ
ncbi:MAG: hypothetical protein OSJ72_15135 [Lachnospiraceae bacterium]|nr:hypothetical protein [Lachnospiraceae bacterium]